MTDATGALLFSRYAWPPNALGYCGPPGSGLLDRMEANAVDALAEEAPKFDGAFPYLRAIATAWGIPDPLDVRVVSAYWLGNDLLSTGESLGDHLSERFRKRLTDPWAHLDAIADGMVPHHAHHVFCIYPWTGMLRGAAPGPALEILDRCRIRFGEVLSVEGDRATVALDTLTWDGHRFGRDPVAEEFSVGAAGLDAEVGDLVTTHWAWVCDRIDRTTAQAVTRWERRALDLAETRLQGIPLDSAPN
jgi:hypothetical protein